MMFPTIRPFLIVLVIFCLLMGLSCDNDTDTQSVATKLANALTEALDIDDAKVKNGLPPEESDDSDQPDIDSLSSDELALELGDEFELFVYPAADNESDSPLAGDAFQSDDDDDTVAETNGEEPAKKSLARMFKADPEDVREIILYVRDATSYIVVDSEIESEGFFRIVGKLKKDNDLEGESFKIDIALVDKNDLVGDYETFRIEVGDGDGDGDDNGNAELEALVRQLCQVWMDDRFECGTAYSSEDECVESYTLETEEYGCVPESIVFYQCAIDAFNASDETTQMDMACELPGSMAQSECSSEYYDATSCGGVDTDGDITTGCTNDEECPEGMFCNLEAIPPSCEMTGVK